ncbi:Ras and Rab interactor 1 [Oryzias melastigma]|uniref:Ras and Rab interactor 1 n=1 Tax=Oryzias melastigma TaxID=30732 RepID=A0A3B3BJ03_ORYME|nr:ras and Rab interactor 1-like [Oryzias melastigma]XP_036071075.1 ras and Rab interactor 1-like [Oryzias melastigma]KAF6719156.1 Ras and Rab interactor 1 [Oryzias melastigma]
MAQQEDPLYDFPEPIQPLKSNLQKLQRGRGSLRSISVLDRLLLTVPVWLQLSINPATALHILQREPPGSFLVRKSRTSQRSVLCVRLADESVPSFVQEFGIRKEQSTLSLETSAISFPDLPRLISFYCVSRDVLPFPLELPEAIAKATSHKELESISHMGIEFWSSQLNVRGPRDALKLKVDQKPDETPASAVAPPPSTPTPPDSAPHLESDNLLQKDPNATLFQEFCPIMTRSPKELDCGSGLGALCFINPLFPQSGNNLTKRRMFKQSLKVRVSTETCTLLSPPLAPPPPPPLMPKTKGKGKAKKQAKEITKLREDCVQVTQPGQTGDDHQPLPHIQDSHCEDKANLSSETPHLGVQETGDEKRKAGIEKMKEELAQLPAAMDNLQTDYMKPSPLISFSHIPSLYKSPSTCPMTPPLFPKASSLSPISPSPVSLSPNLSPSLSPKFHVLPSLSPKASSAFSCVRPFQPLQTASDSAYAVPTVTDQQRSGKQLEKGDRNTEKEDVHTKGEEKDYLDLEKESCTSSDLEDKSGPPLEPKQTNSTSLQQTSTSESK